MSEIHYTEKFIGKYYEYRQVVLPKSLGPAIEHKGLLSEQEWRSLGVIQSKGWEHFQIHLPEPHILLFRRKLGTDPTTGEVSQRILKLSEAEYQHNKQNPKALLEFS